MAYAAMADVYNLGVPAQAVGFLSTTQQTAILQASSDYADGFFRARWGSTAVPLVSWDAAVTEAVAKIAAYRMIRVRGFKSNASADGELRQAHDDAVNWLHLVQRQQAHPLVTLANANAPGAIQPNLVSSSVVNVLTGATGKNRGW